MLNLEAFKFEGGSSEHLIHSDDARVSFNFWMVPHDWIDKSTKGGLEVSMQVPLISSGWSLTHIGSFQD